MMTPAEIAQVTIEMQAEAEKMQREIQEELPRQRVYIKHVIKESWPREISQPSDLSPSIVAGASGFGVRTVSYSLKCAAIESPVINLSDYFSFSKEERDNLLAGIKRTLSESLRWMWSQTFQRDIIRILTHRSITRDQSLLVSNVALPRHVDIWGKEVSPYAHVHSARGHRLELSKKYRRAATQIVTFDPDAVHFQFPDIEQWAGQFSFRALLVSQTIGQTPIGFIRVLLKYAAKPVRPDLGEVITIVPPGLRGLLWYALWKLFRFVP